MRRFLPAALLIAALTACSPDPAPPGVNGNTGNLPTLTRLWSLAEPKTLGQTTLAGDLLLGGRPQLTAIDIRAHKVAFNLPLEIDTIRTSFTALSDQLIALTGIRDDTLTIFSKSGQVVNTVKLPGGMRQGINQLGPIVVGTSLYVVSGPVLYKFRTADLLRSDAQPVWTRSYPGYSLASLLVPDEDHIVVSVNAEVSRSMVALNGQGQQRWTVDVAPATQTVSSAYILSSYKDLVIAHAGAAGLQAYKLETGVKAWADFPNTDICPGGHSISTSNLTIAADKIYMGPSGGTCVQAYQADTGKLAWVFNAPNDVTFDTKPLYLNGVVYASNNVLWALDAETGKALAQAPDEVGDNTGMPLAYDPVDNQLLHWGSTGVFAYRPLR